MELLKMNAASGGQDIVKAVSQVRGLFEQVGLVLQSVESRMKERGWEPRSGNTSVAGASYTMNYPKNWLPYFVFRFYKHKSFPSKLVAMSVILDDESGEGRVAEPIASGIVFDYGEGIEIQNDWNFNYAGWHIYMPDYNANSSNDGTVLRCKPTAHWREDNCTAVDASAFGVPLVEIADAKALLDRVVVPLDSLARTAIGTR
jgi:hypothetical protein